MKLELAFEEIIEDTESVYETELLNIGSWVMIAFIMAIILGVVLYLIFKGVEQ